MTPSSTATAHSGAATTQDPATEHQLLQRDVDFFAALTSEQVRPAASREQRQAHYEKMIKAAGTGVASTDKSLDIALTVYVITQQMARDTLKSDTTTNRAQTIMRAWSSLKAMNDYLDKYEPAIRTALESVPELKSAKYLPTVLKELMQSVKAFS